MDTRAEGFAKARLGASVPFKGDPLLGARVRGDQRHGLVMMLRNFADLDSTYILPWRDAPRSFVMNRFDSALHSAVEETAATTPDAVSTAVRRVNLSGAAGQQTASLEQRRIEAEQAQEAQINSALVARLMMDLEVDVRQLRCASTGSEVFRDTKTKLKACSNRIGISSTELLQRIEELAFLVHPTGLPQRHDTIDTAGHLRKLTTEVAACFAFFSGCGAGASDTISSYYARAARVADATVTKAVELLANIDANLTDLLTVFTEWQLRCELIRSSIDDLAWLLDGWDIALEFAAGNLVSVLDSTAVVNRLVALIPPDSAPGLKLRTIH